MINKTNQINKIKYSCIIPKWLKTYRINRILDSLKSDIEFLEKYNNDMLYNNYYMIEAGAFLNETKNLHKIYKY